MVDLYTFLSLLAPSNQFYVLISQTQRELLHNTSPISRKTERILPMKQGMVSLAKQHIDH